ncbi:MAG: hypothetical protein NZ561_01305 [Phycisphaerae bacterium]|nr:hypothetical protein [Phycisphaerae bacterium]MDW8261856.1 hypothetical protein [Phycisphaerales bacterium]
MGSLRFGLPVAGLILALTGSAQSAITVTSEITRSGDGGVRMQAVIKDPTTFNDALGSGTLTAVAIKEVHSAVFIIDSLDKALRVEKRRLTPAQTYGLGLPFGETEPPLTDPDGPWFGLVWPFRDQYDYFPGPFDPLGDEVGTPVNPSPNVYGFVDIDGIVRGGPTDPTPAGASINRLMRGLTGNGLTGPATYFQMDIEPLSGDAERFITIQILSATARVVVQNSQGAFSEIQVNVPPLVRQLQLPEPATGALLLALGGLLPRRRA